MALSLLSSPAALPRTSAETPLPAAARLKLLAHMQRSWLLDFVREQLGESDHWHTMTDLQLREVVREVLSEQTKLEFELEKTRLDAAREQTKLELEKTRLDAACEQTRLELELEKTRLELA